jgi:hypothetical protein
MVLYSCQDRNKSLKTDEISIFSDINIFTKIDSISLEYPDSLFPQYIPKIVFQNRYLYVLNLSRNSKYPILKFDCNGNFIKTVGRNGRGPFEYDFQLSNMCGNNKYILAFSISLNSLYLIENDKILRKARIPFEAGGYMTGITFLNDNKILCTKKYSTNKGTTNNKDHILVLNEDLKIIDSLQQFPINADLTTYGSVFSFFSLYKSNNSYITHHGYPPNIYLISENNGKVKVDTIYKPQLDEFEYCDNAEEIKKLYDEQRISPVKFSESISFLRMIYKEDEYILGEYIVRKNKKSIRDKKAGSYLFLLKNGEKIFETKFPLNEMQMLQVYDNGINYVFFYKDKDNILRVKLYLLKLNKMFLETL